MPLEPPPKGTNVLASNVNEDTKFQDEVPTVGPGGTAPFQDTDTQTGFELLAIWLYTTVPDGYYQYSTFYSAYSAFQPIFSIG